MQFRKKSYSVLPDVSKNLKTLNINTANQFSEINNQINNQNTKITGKDNSFLNSAFSFNV